MEQSITIQNGRNTSKSNLQIQPHSAIKSKEDDDVLGVKRRKCDSGSVTPLTRIPRKRQCDEVTTEPVPSKNSKMEEPEGMAVGILQLPAETLLKIFVLVVLEDAIRTLALTCKRFWEVVREDYFLQEAHFAWLDSVVTWMEYSVEYTKTYRIPFQISSCRQCRNLYKDSEGYRGHGRRGQLLGMYSEDDLAGFCSIDCFHDAGGTFHENG
ncbi:hypothetical protein JOQ06_020837 [Pogonophryne albipinna]|uniref:F-box domain-containing protein n=1 Tax=Pogonophryne albipinna TaxID=1090488 RepID=A0AAD6BUX3_9TELE|nr:hypothetical protein JOQ06_020837 [Pogonophryne albipinna]